MVAASGGTYMRVLVVDDEEDVQILVRLVLESEGHEVLVASNGDEARAFCQQGRVDALVLDVSLPTEDGPTVLATLREAGIAPTEVFLASAITPRALGVMAADLGAHALSKPFTVATLKQALAPVLEG
jgi:DNA-binding response OmpR family regulator